ncbi:hypothetical protein NG701_07390 [Pseudarthrobacter sp. HLT3-5]|nr:hypothetical protein [Pseudarthrobacter sp. HLT3-5]
MVRVTPDEVGQALYHLLKYGKGLEQLQEELQEEVAPYVERRTQVQRVIRALPNGTVEVIEQITTDERLY